MANCQEDFRDKSWKLANNTINSFVLIDLKYISSYNIF